MISKESILRKLEPFVVPAIIVLVGLTSFGLGRLSALEEQKGDLIIRESQGVVVAQAPAGLHNFVASRNGERYYIPTCSGAQRIKEENKIWFASEEEARSAGYTPAAGCSGLSP